MPRTFAKMSVRGNKNSSSIVWGAIKGQNNISLPEAMDIKFAENVTGYIQYGEGKLESSKGNKIVVEKTGITSINASAWYHGNSFLVGYGTTVAVMNEDTGTNTEIKTNFTKNVTDIVTTGDYGFVATGGLGEKIYRISRTLAYNTQTANFTAGLIVTGATSGATAIILSDADAGASGTLTLGSISGTFTNGEIITDSSTGSATTNGTLGYAATIISNSFSADILFIRSAYGGGSPGVRLFLGGVGGNKKRCVYSRVYTGTNPPWDSATDWDTTATLATSAGQLYTNEDITSITSRGESFVVGQTSRRVVFDLGSIDLAGTVAQDVKVRSEYIDHGMARGSIDTAYGTVYFEKAGLRMMSSVMTQGAGGAMTSSSSDTLISAALGRDYFKNANFDNATIVHDSYNNLILASFANDSTTNNEVLIYNLETKSIAIRKGWNINRFSRSPTRVYGSSSLDGKFFKLFEGYTDNGNPIQTQFTQEIKSANPHSTYVLKNFLIQAILFEGETIKIHFDIENEQGGLVNDYQIWTITGTASKSALASWGSAGYGAAGWGSGSGGQNIIAQKYETDMNIEFVNCKVRFVAYNSTPHTINYFIPNIESGSNINLNNLTST